jgi:hypothetical protein
MPRTPVTGLQCAIRADLDNGFVRLEAIAESDEAVKGHYTLSVIKRSSTGASRNNQSGGFELTASREQVLTTIVLDPSTAGHYLAELSLTSNRGSVTCRSPS